MADAVGEVPPAAAARGRGWTILMPSAAAAEWRMVTLGGVETAAGASAGSRSGEGREVAIQMAALLAASGAGGFGGVARDGGNGQRAGCIGEGFGDAARPVARDGGDGQDGGVGGLKLVPVPVIFIPNLETEKLTDEEKGLDTAKVIYGALLFGSLGFIDPVKTALSAKGIEESVLWAVFGSCWVFLSIGFHMSFYRGQNIAMKAYIRNIAHFSLMIFCCFVTYYLYLLLPDKPTSVAWLIQMVLLLVFGHICTWFLVLKAPTVAFKEDSSGTSELPKAPKLSRGLWTRLRGWWPYVRHGWWSRRRQGPTREE